MKCKCYVDTTFYGKQKFGSVFQTILILFLTSSDIDFNTENNDVARRKIISDPPEFGESLNVLNNAFNIPLLYWSLC